jgi:hypothetical protein
MEYLMTYGWAILIISIVLAALWQLGVFGSASTSPKASPGACRVSRQSVSTGGVQVALIGTCSGLLPQFATQLGGFNSNIIVPSSGYDNFGTNSFTITAWIKTSNVVTQDIVGKAGTPGWDFETNSVVKFVSTGDAFTATGAKTVTDGNWHFVAISATVPSGTAQLYTDGVADGSPAPTSTQTITNAAAMVIGSTSAGVTGFFKGTIANVQIYNTSLTASEILALYNEGIGGAPIPMPAIQDWWPLNGDTYDYGGNVNNGSPSNVIMNSTWSIGYVVP